MPRIETYTEATAVTNDDLIPIVDDPAGLAVVKKLPYSVIKADIDAAEAAATSDLNAHVDAQPGSAGAHSRFLSLVAHDESGPAGFSTAAVGAWENLPGSEVIIATDEDGVSLNGRTVAVETMFTSGAFLDSANNPTTVPENSRRAAVNISLDDGATWSNGGDPTVTPGAAMDAGAKIVSTVRPWTSGVVTTQIRVKVDVRQHTGAINDLKFAYNILRVKVWE